MKRRSSHWRYAERTRKLQMLKKTISIGGGGLAGLSLGIALRHRDVPVVIHEAGVYPRHRVCGEFISGVTDATLGNLGVLHHLADAIPLSRARWHDTKQSLGEMTVSARGISRWLLDDRLRQEFIALGGTLHMHSRVQPGPEVVWAAGRVRRQGPWIGLKFHATNLPLSSDLEMHIGTNGYIGLARIENHRINVCGLFRAPSKVRERGPSLLLGFLRTGGLDALADRLSQATIDDASFCGTAGFRLGGQNGPPFSIGDAAYLIPPFTGNGMTIAFESAECALEPLMDFSNGRLSWEAASTAVQQAQNAKFRRRLIMAEAMHMVLTMPWGARIVSQFARRKMVPFQLLLRFVR